MRRNLLRSMLLVVSLLMGINGAFAAEGDELPVAENIAALKAMENGTEAKLMLNNTQVTLQVMGLMGSQTTLIEDATGGLQIISSYDDMGEPSGLGEIFTTVGQTFNGYIYCRYVNESGMVGIDAIDATATDTYTVTTSEVTPKDVTMAEACTADGTMRYVRLSDVTVTFDMESFGNGDILFPFVLHQGNNTMYFYDMMQTFISNDPETGEYIYPENIKDLNGYVVDLGGEYGFIPMSLIPSIENIAAAKDVEDGTEIALALNGTKVTQAGRAMFNYIEDESGALKTDYSFSNLEGFYQGLALTGYIYGTITKDENGLCSINMSDNTGRSQIEGVETTITPTATTLADIIADPAAIAYKYINLKNVTVTSEGEGYEAIYYITDGKNTIEFDNWTFYTLPEDFLPEINKLITVNGFVDASWYGDFVFMPYGDEYEAEYKPATVVNSIAELKAQPSGTSVKLMLNNVKVTVVEQNPISFDENPDVYIEDESGAIQVGSDLAWGGIGESGLDNYYFTAVGSTLDGDLYCTYVNGYGERVLTPSAHTRESKITLEIGTVTPKEISIDGIDIEADEFRLVKLSNATMTYDEEIGFTLTQGENSIIVQDKYNKATELTEKLTGEAPEAESLTIASATGILMQQATDWDEDTWEPIAYATYLVPVGEGLIEGTGTGINAVNSASQNSGDVYTIDGVKVRKAGESLNGLAKGLYIVNGKKVVIK